MSVFRRISILFLTHLLEQRMGIWGWSLPCILEVDSVSGRTSWRPLGGPPGKQKFKEESRQTLNTGSGAMNRGKRVEPVG